MWRGAVGFFLACVCAFAHADIRQSSADSFFVAFSSPVSATPTKVFADIAQPQQWWDSEHTWSGKASNLSLKPEAGGCFCEQWKEGSVEHGRVVMALPGKLLRLETALGPLQEFALKGTLSFWIKPGDDGAAQLTVEYRVNGASGSGLDAFAPKVDAMLGAQVARLVRYVDSGNPDAPPVADAPKENARAALLGEWARSAAETAAAQKSSAPSATPSAAKKRKPDDRR